MKIRLFLFLLMPLAAISQPAKRLQPGKLYAAGEVIFAPHFGFKATVPTGYSGLLPRDTEVFLLNAETYPAEIFVFGREHGTLPAIKQDWEKGIALCPLI